jgi:2-hydroxycyclohexanecarboxyl-CoA dehydrogenase
MEHQGTVAVVTGGAGGIGAATCRVLAREGARVAVADIDLGRAEALAAQLNLPGTSAPTSARPSLPGALGDPAPADSRAVALAVDVTSLDSVRAMLARAGERLGAVTVLVNNAGWDQLGSLLDSDPALWHRIIDVNLHGQLHGARAFLELVRARGTPGGRLVNVGSDAGRLGAGGEAVLSAARGGVIALTRSLAREGARLDVAVNCVCPGLTDATPPDLLRQAPPVEHALDAIPLKRPARPEEIAEAISFLASTRASYITGQALSVDGGLAPR